MKAISGVVLGCAVLLLGACGGGAKLGGGKHGAAQALHQATFPLRSARQSSLSGLGSGIDFNKTVVVNGKHGGTAKVEMKLTAQAFTGSAQSIITYDRFNHDGKNALDGTLTTTLEAEASRPTALAVLEIKGKVTIQGEVNDFVDADLTQTLTLEALAPTSVKVSLTLDGKIATSADTHNYSNETITFDTGDSLPTAPNP